MSWRTRKVSSSFSFTIPFERPSAHLPLDASSVLGPLFGQYHDGLESLKLVEYVGEEKGTTCFQLNQVNVKLQVYQLYETNESFQEHAEIPQAQITNMPHVIFDGQWDEYAADSPTRHRTFC